MNQPVATVLVHHRNFPEIGEVLAHLLDAGVDPSGLIVVDNSEDPQMERLLRAEMPARAELLVSENKGYGAAANLGLRALRARRTPYGSVLITTHEVRPCPSAVRLLQQALEDTSVMVVGPTLVIGDLDGDKYWSLGGRLSYLNEPRHIGSGMHFPGTADHLASGYQARSRDFLDGAFCLYRWCVFERLSFPEEYFLYFEEVDLHWQIRHELGEVLWVPNAVVRQRSGGIPPYLHGRNLQLFQHRHGSLVQKLVTTPVAIFRQVLAVCMRRRSRKDVSAMIRGWRSGLRR